MAIITLTIETGNSAFEDNPNEIQEIFEKAAEKIAIGEEEFSLKDSNGNKVGEVKTEYEDSQSLSI